MENRLILQQSIQKLFDKGNSVLFRWKNDGGWSIDYASKNVLELFGYTQEEFLEGVISYAQCVHPDFSTKVQDEVQKASQADEDFFEHKPYKIITKDKQEKWVLDQTVIVRDENGEITHFIGYLNDISKTIALGREKDALEKENEATLKKVFKQLQEAQKIAKIGLWEYSHSDEKVVWSDEMFNITEIQKEDFDNTYEPFVKIFHPHDLEEFSTGYENSLRTKKPFETTHRLLMPDGRIKYILEKLDSEFDINGTPIISRGVMQDITKFTMLDATLRKERRRFKTFIDGASDGIFIINKNLELVDYSKVAKEMLGYSDAEMATLRITNWDVKMSEEDLRTHFEELTETPITFETIHKRKNGSTYNAAVTAAKINIDGESFINSSVRDISEIKKLQEILLYEKNFINTIIESANAIVVAVDSHGKMIKFNTYAQKFTGYTQEEISQEPYQWKCLIAPEIQDTLFGFIENAKQGHIIKSYQNQWYAKSGEAKMFEWSNTLVKKEDGSMDYIVSVGIDITQNEEQKTFLNLLMNSQSHMIVLADGSELKYVNQAVLDFFDFNSLEEMKEKYICICDTFIEKSSFFHLGKITNEEHWTVEIQKLPAEKQIVSIYSYKHKQERVFKVNIEHYSQSKIYLLTFVDISNTMMKQFELEHKSNHDALTQAYNRAYFYENYPSILSSHTRNQELTAIAMIDIDHFKVVNDTYGHDVGDEVLKKLVKVIHANSRQSDTLIRWGGEEFILLLATKDEKSLYKTLNSLRKKIQAYKMPTVGNITVSMGASIHANTATIDESIKQADANLYISKHNGRNKVTVQ